MITRRQLREIHRVDLPLHILEQDYTQSLFLLELYRNTERLISKGGTFLRHAHGLDRYSEDLDFTLHGGTAENPEEALQSLTDTAGALGSYGMEASLEEMKDDDLTLTARLRYRGPLYDGSERSRGRMKIEVSKRNDVLIQPKWVRLFFEYPETRLVNVRGLVKREALAEKLRALSTRSKGRDLYDVWFLLRQGTGIDRRLFDGKMAIIEEEPEVSLTVSEREWDRDLGVLLPRPPEYPQVLEEVIKMIREQGVTIAPERTPRRIR